MSADEEPAGRVSAERAAIKQIADVAATVGRKRVSAAEYLFEIVRMVPVGLSPEASGWIAAHILRAHNCCDAHLEVAMASMRATLAEDRVLHEQAEATVKAQVEALGLGRAAKH